MAILAFQKPDKVVMLEATDKFGKFRISSFGARLWRYHR